MSTDPLVQGRLMQTLRAAVDGYFDIQNVRFDVEFKPFDDAIRLRGHFLTDTEQAYAVIARRARTAGFLIFFREEDEEPVIYAALGDLPVGKPNWQLFGILLAATLASVFFVGGYTGQGWEMDWKAGASFAIPLILILLFHEFGHFLVSRRNHMATSPPYFIPMPFSIFGTLGAVIVMRAPPKNRKQLFQMAVAGPLGGLILAIPFLFIGLSQSEVGPLPPPPYILEGNSIFYLLAKWLVFHQWLPSGGMDVQLHNMAFAAWVGLFITGLNLIPAGQLDGGHIVYTLFGNKVKYLSYAVVGAFLVMSIKYPGWLLWTALIFFLGRVYAVPMDDLTPLPRKYKVLGYFMLVLLVLLFTPIPIQIIK
jgi:membrane-associated protease RseP (regulator of RpoE activity)